jgi:ABC-type sugar transport system permease subunit
MHGKYNDLTPDWYMNIGTIIILTMIFNISFPIIEMLLASIIKCIKRCWDRKCCMRKTSCKTKSEYIELFSNDIYPIEERYAFLVSVFLITFAFSCIIPILNLVCGLSLMLLYFADRILVFKIYQTPVNYGA